jgi:OOP family OmpA-OmpF porin
VLYDGRLNVGLQYAFGQMFEEPIIVGSADSDGVGVYDSTDMCPATPRGMMVDVNGCPSSADDDGDGVPNDRDACPGTPPGTLVDGRGCPATVPMLAPPSAMNPDEDGDGVPNERDACPHTPRGLRVDATGCAVKSQSIVILKSVNFEFDKAVLTREARAILDDVVAGMKGQPSMQVEIDGHTDALGTESYNLALSQRRADAVRTYLASQGVDGSRMKAEGYGESAPVADNNSEEGRAQNRRVEFKVVKQ